MPGIVKRGKLRKFRLFHHEVIAIFGDFQRGYHILDGKAFSIQRLSELCAEAGLVGFRIHAQVGGYAIRPSNKVLVLLKERA